MINATFFKDSDICRGFEFFGHADYSDEGSDIICAAVSALVINCVNSIETFTEDHIVYSDDDDSGYKKLEILDEVSYESMLFLNSLILGIKQITEIENESYIQLTFKEV